MRDVGQQMQAHARKFCRTVRAIVRDRRDVRRQRATEWTRRAGTYCHSRCDSDSDSHADTNSNQYTNNIATLLPGEPESN